MNKLRQKSLLIATILSLSAYDIAFAQLFSSPPPPSAAAEAAPARRALRKKTVRRFTPPPVAQEAVAPPTAFKFDANLEEIFTTVKQKAQNLIELAQASNDHLLFKIGADFDLYLNNWQKNHAVIMKSDAKSAPPAIQKFLAEADAFLAKVSNKTNQPIEEILNQHEELISRIPAVKHLPQVFSYSPYLVQPLNQKKIILTIKTLSFTYGRPKLSLNGATYEPLSEMGGLWLFEVETSSLTSKTDEASIVKADLEVSKPKDNSTEIETYKLPLNLMIMPAKNGTFTLDYTILETVPKSEIKSIAFTHTSKAAENDCKDFVQAAAGAGRVIKNVSEIYQAGEQGSSQLLKTSTADFTVKLCAKRQNKPLQGYPQGNQNSIWQWEEHWFEYVEKTVSVEGIIPPAPELLNIETNITKLQKFNLVVKGNDKREYSFNGSVEKGLYSVKFNPSTKVISLSPKTHEPRLN
jgi:hypothetical protein